MAAALSNARWAISIIAALGCLLWAAPRASALEWERGSALEARLDELRAPQSAQGWILHAGPFITGLAQAQKTVFTVPTPVGAPVSIMGICDRNCYDINFRVLSVTGAVIVEDSGDGDLPSVEFVGPREGRVLVELSMADCGDRACFSRFDVYHKPTAPSRVRGRRS